MGVLARRALLSGVEIRGPFFGSCNLDLQSAQHGGVSVKGIRATLPGTLEVQAFFEGFKDQKQVVGPHNFLRLSSVWYMAPISWFILLIRL